MNRIKKFLIKIGVLKNNAPKKLVFTIQGTKLVGTINRALEDE